MAAFTGKDRDVTRIGTGALAGALLLVLSMGALAQAPMAGPFAAQANMTCAKALASIPRDNSEMGSLARVFDDNAAKLRKSPKDAGAKKAYVASGVKFEQYIVHGATKLSSPVKYRAGLGLCRLVLAVDKNNPQCKKDMKDIIDIYMGMHREIPK
jgi:hypothetical protein